MAPFNHSHFQTTMSTDTSNKMEGLRPIAIKGTPDQRGSIINKTKALIPLKSHLEDGEKETPRESSD